MNRWKLLATLLFVLSMAAMLIWLSPYLYLLLLLKDAGYVLEGPYVPPNVYARIVRAVSVDVTAYNCVRAQTDDTPYVTASGMRCGGDVIAVSRDLLPSIPYGTIVTVDGRRYVVGDTMAMRWRRRVDIPMASRSGADRHGIRRGKLKVLGTGR